jgi:tetratricopeptide (TPR) repeat protein
MTSKIPALQIVRNTLATVLFLSSSSWAAEVETRISSREAYVGAPVVLQISIVNADDFQEPELPSIDGCEIRLAGTPSQSSQITIINGRRSESRSVVIQYFITPKREGTFEIPAMSMQVDGRPAFTKPVSIVATKSETGDLLFVEIIGEKNQVFVGEPLELTLKIWVKPYQDTENRVTLSEGDMWQLISRGSSWGVFEDRMRELTENNQRPGGEEVLRDDGQGNQRSYYLYEITATIYPTRTGKIESGDTKIVADYPTSIGRSRSAMDDFFGGSPFGNRLTITSTRPIVGEATTGETEVVPVPTEGRPSDYRGAVGRYQIVTQATPLTVDAGDPITLNIGIEGTGPMELVQAPPLSDLQVLTDDFRIADQSLPGFARDSTKVFSTTIRPLREGIAKIPPIPFSFFDPEAERYETVFSDPIEITVNKSEVLSIDSIMGNGNVRNSQDDSQLAEPTSAGPDFSNLHTADVLVAETPPSNRPWWSMFVIAPPFVWLASWLVMNRATLSNRLSNLDSPLRQCVRAIDATMDGHGILLALTHFIARRSKKRDLSPVQAIGALRLQSMLGIANEVESFFSAIESGRVVSDNPARTVALREEAREIAKRLDVAFNESKIQPVRSLPRRSPSTRSQLTERSSVLLLAITLSVSFYGPALAADIASSDTKDDQAQGRAAPSDLNMSPQEQLTKSQQEAILNDGAMAYSEAQIIVQFNPLEAEELFQTAAERYQLLTNSGIQNSKLYANLANAYFLSGQLGRAILNYERSKALNPNDRQVHTNLMLADSKVQRIEPSANPSSVSAESGVLAELIGRVRSVNRVFIQTVSMRSLIVVIASASLCFWGLMIARTFSFPVPNRISLVPAAVLIFGLVSFAIFKSETELGVEAIVLVDKISLRSGDGDQFAELYPIEAAQGNRVRQLDARGDWKKIQAGEGKVGWVVASSVEAYGE